MKDYRTLKVWEKSHGLAVLTYRITENYPKSELYGLVSQIRRAAISIPSNIAEGCGRWGDGDFSRFLQIAMGSLFELDYQFLLSRDLGYIPEATYIELSARIDEVKRMLGTLIHKVRADS